MLMHEGLLVFWNLVFHFFMSKCWDHTDHVSRHESSSSCGWNPGITNKWLCGWQYQWASWLNMLQWAFAQPGPSQCCHYLTKQAEASAAYAIWSIGEGFFHCSNRIIMAAVFTQKMEMYKLQLQACIISLSVLGFTKCLYFSRCMSTQSLHTLSRASFSWP